MAKSFSVGPISLTQGVFVTAAGLLLAGLGAAATTPAGSLQNILGNASIVLGVALFLWGTTINRRHLWQPWWRGPPNPFHVKVWTRNWDYEEGKDVGGIRWQKAFAHIRVNLTNITEKSVEDVTALLMPDQPILESRARCEFAECRIGNAAPVPDITVRAKLKSGAEIDIPATQMKQIHFGPPHRLVCERIPAGSSIEIHLATVVPDETGGRLFKPVRTPPEHINILLQWQVDGDCCSVDRCYPLQDDE